MSFQRLCIGTFMYNPFLATCFQTMSFFIRNLQGDIAKPVTKDEPGVSMVSGFSPNMLKAFLGEGKRKDVHDSEPESDKMAADTPGVTPKAKDKPKFTPEENMMNVLRHESYANLKVID